MARVVVLGYGNPLRGDDAAGWCVAEALAQWQWTGDALLVRTAQQVVPEWASDLSRAEVVYFVDASPGIDAPLVEPVAADGDSPLLDGHALTPSRLLRLTEAVYGRAPKALLMRVPARDFDFGETLSPAARAGVDAAVEMLATLLRA